ncbi:hypothetical protein ILYODFUR_033078 [Ilyodon furcidens]|uniref:Uncharacterized protein n=1 Tax=Ilyodon furcidens TaxID=33524 RepID=A0ABV0TNU5_9TELE
MQKNPVIPTQGLLAVRQQCYQLCHHATLIMWHAAIKRVYTFKNRFEQTQTEELAQLILLVSVPKQLDSCIALNCCPQWHLHTKWRIKKSNYDCKYITKSQKKQKQIECKATIAISSEPISTPFNNTFCEEITLKHKRDIVSVFECLPYLLIKQQAGNKILKT